MRGLGFEKDEVVDLPRLMSAAKHQHQIGPGANPFPGLFLFYATSINVSIRQLIVAVMMSTTSLGRNRSTPAFRPALDC